MYWKVLSRWSLILWFLFYFLSNIAILNFVFLKILLNTRFMIRRASYSVIVDSLLTVDWSFSVFSQKYWKKTKAHWNFEFWTKVLDESRSYFRSGSAISYILCVWMCIYVSEQHIVPWTTGTAGSFNKVDWCVTAYPNSHSLFPGILAKCVCIMFWHKRQQGGRHEAWL